MKEHELDIRLERAFTPMPAQMKAEIEYAFERGEKEMKKRYKIMSLLSTAAILVVVFAAGAMAVNGLNDPGTDHVLQAAPEEYKLISAAEGEEANPELATEEPEHFYDGDFTEPEALYILLSNAYWNYAHENDLDMDSRAVFAAAGELNGIFKNHEGNKEQMMEPIRECLQSVLGFDLEFIAKHYLTNDVIGCLYAAAETIYLEETVVLEPESEENIELREEFNYAVLD